MRREETKNPPKQPQRMSLELTLNNQPTGSWVIQPREMHDLLTAYWTSSRRLTGAEYDLAIEIAEDLGPMPCDYAILMLEIIEECVRYIAYRADGTPSVEVRLSELRRNAKLNNIVLEVINRGPELPTPRELSEGLLRLRSRTEDWNGFLMIDGSCESKIMFRAALPLVSFSQ